MDIVSLWNFLTTYGGVIVGVVLLLLGTMVLPSGLKKYVLTAGLAIAAFRIAQIACSGKRLAKADAERVRLREELNKNSAEKDNLIKKQEALNTQAIKVKQDLNHLDAQARALDASATTAAAAKIKLDKEAAEMQARHAKLLQETRENEKILALFSNADEAIRDLERVR